MYKALVKKLTAWVLTTGMLLTCVPQYGWAAETYPEAEPADASLMGADLTEEDVMEEGLDVEGSADVSAEVNVPAEIVVDDEMPEDGLLPDELIVDDLIIDDGDTVFPEEGDLLRQKRITFPQIVRTWILWKIRMLCRWMVLMD